MNVQSSSSNGGGSATSHRRHCRHSPRGVGPASGDRCRRQRRPRRQHFATDVLQIRGAAELPEAPAELLTDRELSVLTYLSSLSSNEEIADRLGISVNTVKQHLKSVNRKLGVTSRCDAYRVPGALGLLSDSPST